MDARTHIHLLLIEENAEDVRQVQRALKGLAGVVFTLVHVDTVAGAMVRLDAGGIDAVLIDLTQHDGKGLKTFQKIHAKYPAVAVVVLSALDDERAAVSAVRRGAQDYLVKGRSDGKTFARVLRYAVERKRLGQMKDEFVSTMSHEIRTPLTIVKGALDNLAGGIAGPLSAPQRELLGMVTRNVDRLTRIIRDVLDLSRLESGRSVVRKTPLALTVLAREVVAEFEKLAQHRQLATSADGPDALEVMADRDLLRCVLDNLVENALRFAKTKITIRTHEEGRFVGLTVSNDGPHIAPEDQERLFDKFQQVNRPVGGAGYKGTGLGLAICREILDLHHGSIWVDSVPNQGVSFHLRLPHVAPEVSEA